MTISGFCANICYSDGYSAEMIEKKIRDTDANINRFHRVTGTLHHSIADHSYITVYLGGISKMMAMILNSLEFYTTSERSARYTNVGKEASGQEAELYSKWMDIIDSRIESRYPKIDSKRRNKLAMENARYFISVFNPSTSMVYTTSYRQWSYIAQWFDRFISEAVDTAFTLQIKSEMKTIRDSILKSGIGSTEIEDAKHRYIRFLARQTSNPIVNSSEQLDEMYRVKYQCSMACLAQAQRHRTLKYVMDFIDDSSIEPYEYYIPTIILDDNELAAAWVEDMKSVSERFPQGILVDVIESGDVQDFILKCEERLCGRAQLEVAKSTANTLYRLYSETENPILQDILQPMFIPGERVKAKCELIGGCKENCEFGAKEAVSREI
jgi:hypothetical protein